MKRIQLFALFCLVVGLAVLAVPAGSQDFQVTVTPTIDFATYQAVFNTPTPQGPTVVSTPGAPQTLVHDLDHDHLVMVSKRSDCATNVQETGEDCTSYQGQSFSTIKDVFPNQLVRVSGDDVMIILPVCPTDPAERALVDIQYAPVKFQNLVNQAVSALQSSEACFFQMDMSQITGSFYNSLLLENATGATLRIAIVIPSGGDITTFVPKWGTKATDAAWTMAVSIATERVVIPPQTVDRFAPDGTAVPNCAGSLLDMALSVDPAATTVEELTVALKRFVGMGCENMNLTVGSLGDGLSYHMQGVYARYLNPSYYDLAAFLRGAELSTVQPTMTLVAPTPTQTPVG